MFALIIDLGRTKKLHHTISTETCQLICQAARRMPVYHKEEVRKLIENMLKRDAIASTIKESMRLSNRQKGWLGLILSRLPYCNPKGYLPLALY